MWRFAQDHVLDRLDRAACLWEPSPHVCTVRRVDGRWQADWPDESRTPLAEPTAAWLLWHLEWWWTQTLRSADDLPPRAPAEHAWSGGIDGLVSVKNAWDDVLATADLEREVVGLMPRARPLWWVAGWVNVEFTKNLAELHQVLVRRDNVGGPDDLAVGVVPAPGAGDAL